MHPLGTAHSILSSKTAAACCRRQLQRAADASDHPSTGTTSRTPPSCTATASCSCFPGSDTTCEISCVTDAGLLLTKSTHTHTHPHTYVNMYVYIHRHERALRRGRCRTGPPRAAEPPSGPRLRPEGGQPWAPHSSLRRSLRPSLSKPRSTPSYSHPALQVNQAKGRRTPQFRTEKALTSTPSRSNAH